MIDGGKFISAGGAEQTFKYGGKVDQFVKLDGEKLGLWQGLLILTQALSEELLVSMGNFNLLDLLTQIYPQIGRGVDGFMNISSLVPISLFRPLNLSTLGPA